MADVVVAKQGFPAMALAATFGGPLFNLFLGLGLSLTFENIKVLIYCFLFLLPLVIPCLAKAQRFGSLPIPVYLV